MGYKFTEWFHSCGRLCRAFGTFGEGSSVPQSFSSRLPQDLESVVIHLFIHLYSSSPHRLRGQLL